MHIRFSSTTLYCMKRLLFIVLFCISVVSCFLSCSSCAVSQAANPESLASFYYQVAVELNDVDSAANVNGLLPEQVYIKTPTQTFCRDYQFCIVDGLVYYKLMPDAKYSNPKKKEDVWQPVNGTGLPFPANGKDFPVPSRIVEIAADADSLFAFNSDGEMYQMFTNDIGPGRPFVWLASFGWPEKTQLKQTQLVKNKRAWASGARRQDVLWHEDIFGNPHHYGTMGIETLYFLTEDGQQIRFTDSGLPADFSRNLLGPERGSFIAENLSASADTMFVINKAGEMYTRLADFDTIGCDPMFFRYTYEHLPQKYTGEQYLSNYSPWGLPSEPWLRQPLIPLKGEAKITKYITILQNGKGNAARELRVAGLSPNGETGYYSKAIMDNEPEDWIFVSVPLYLEKESFLPVSSDGVEQDVLDNLYGKKQEFSYVGGLWQDGLRNQDIKCKIPDFPISEGECTLQISYKDETKEITVHPVEIWSYMFRNNPGLDGTSKNFFITFDYDDKVLNSAYPEFEQILKKVFGGKKKVLFSSLASATDKYFRLSVTALEKGRSEQLLSAGSSGKSFVTGSSPFGKTTYTFFLTDTGSETLADSSKSTGFLFYESPSLLQYNSASLKIQPGTEISVQNRTRLDQAVKANKEYMKMLKTELEMYTKYASKAEISRWGYNVADLLTSVTLLNQINFPKIKNITSFGGEIMKENARTYKTQANMNSWIYSHLMELLQQRIKSYEEVQKEIMENQKGVVPVKLRNSFVEYYVNDAALPLSMEGQSMIHGGKNARAFLLPEVPSFPGFCIEIAEKEPCYIMVELIDSVEKIFGLKEPVSKRNPLELEAKFFVLPSSGFLPDEITEIAEKKGWILWDGEKLTVKEKDGLFGKKTIFAGVLP